MTLASLSDVLKPALKGGYAVGGLVVLGWEDARAFVAAGEAENCPIILQAGPGCRAHTPLPVLGQMFRTLAETASIPVVSHLDHGYSYEDCAQAIDCGFTSVMFDGSRKPLEENISETAKIAELARRSGVSLEGEIGFVGYSDGEASHGTDPAEAERFAKETGVDAMAVSVGNVHLQQSKSAEIDRARIDDIQSRTPVPLVIHGGSGIPSETRRELARSTSVCKFNIGTELRMAFGTALRAAINDDPDRFDRVSILKDVEDPITQVARQVIRTIGPART